MKRLLMVMVLVLFAAVVSAQERNVQGIMEKAKAGDPTAQYNAGIMYETGDGLKQDLGLAQNGMKRPKLKDRLVRRIAWD